MLSQKKILSVTHILKKMPYLACAYLHGSALTNHFRKNSDIALLFFPGKNSSLSAEDLLDCTIDSVVSVDTHLNQWLITEL